MGKGKSKSAASKSGGARPTAKTARRRVTAWRKKVNATPKATAAVAAPGRGTADRAQLAAQLRAARRRNDREQLQDLDGRRLAARRAEEAAHGAKPDAGVMRRIDGAFGRLDAKGENQVSIEKLRRELPNVSRRSFDASLNQLRREGRFSLDSHEGLIRPPTKAQRRAAIRGPGGTRLIYVSRG